MAPVLLSLYPNRRLILCWMFRQRARLFLLNTYLYTHIPFDKFWKSRQFEVKFATATVYEKYMMKVMPMRTEININGSRGRHSATRTRPLKPDVRNTRKEHKMTSRMSSPPNMLHRICRLVKFEEKMNEGNRPAKFSNPRQFIQYLR